MYLDVTNELIKIYVEYDNNLCCRSNNLQQSTINENLPENLPDRDIKFKQLNDCYFQPIASNNDNEAQSNECHKHFPGAVYQRNVISDFTEVVDQINVRENFKLSTSTNEGPLRR